MSKTKINRRNVGEKILLYAIQTFCVIEDLAATILYFLAFVILVCIIAIAFTLERMPEMRVGFVIIAGLLIICCILIFIAGKIKPTNETY